LIESDSLHPEIHQSISIQTGPLVVQINGDLGEILKQYNNSRRTKLTRRTILVVGNRRKVSSKMESESAKGSYTKYLVA